MNDRLWVISVDFGRWSFSYESMWVLRSPRAKRISGFRKFRLVPLKDFFDSIGQKLT